MLVVIFNVHVPPLLYFQLLYAHLVYRPTVLNQIILI